MNSMPDPDPNGPDAQDCNPPEPGSREDLLARVVSGELKLGAEPLQAAMRADSEFANEVAELLELHDELCASVPYEELVVEPSAEPWPGADDAIVAQVQQHLGQPDLEQPDLEQPEKPIAADDLPKNPQAVVHRQRWPWTLVALAAAAGLLLTVCYWPSDNGDLPIAPDTTQLGPSEQWPSGSTTRADFVRRGFEWGDLALPADAELTLTVTLANGTTIVDEVDVTGTNHWPLSAELRTNPPTSFDWLLHAHLTGTRDRLLPQHVSLR